MSSRFLQNVREACAIEVNQRTEQHIDDIFLYVQHLEFFAKLEPYQQRALCRTLTLETYAPREYVFEQGDIGHTFYIIFSGSVGVLVPVKDTNTWRTEVFLDAGKCFGELALHNNAPRAASILTSEVTELLVIKKEDLRT